MSQGLKHCLSLDRIARRWAAETGRPEEITPADIAGDLIQAAISGEFEFPAARRDDAPRVEYAYEDHKEDGTPVAKKGLQPAIGPYFSALSIANGNPLTASQVQAYLKARQNASGAKDEDTRQVIARDVFLSIEGLQRWCARPEFAEWARIRGLSQPQFIDGQSGTTQDGSVTRPSKRRVRRGGGRKKGSGSWAVQDQPLIEEMNRLIKSGEVKSAWAAATRVTERARGEGTSESKTKRLHRRYKDQFSEDQFRGGNQV